MICCWNCDNEYDDTVWRHCQRCGSLSTNAVGDICFGIASMAARVTLRIVEAKERVFHAVVGGCLARHPTRHGAALEAFERAWLRSQREEDPIPFEPRDLGPPPTPPVRTLTPPRMRTLTASEALNAMIEEKDTQDLGEFIDECERAIRLYGPYGLVHFTHSDVPPFKRRFDGSDMHTYQIRAAAALRMVRTEMRRRGAGPDQVAARIQQQRKAARMLQDGPVINVAPFR